MLGSAIEDRTIELVSSHVWGERCRARPRRGAKRNWRLNSVTRRGVIHIMISSRCVLMSSRTAKLMCLLGLGAACLLVVACNSTPSTGPGAAVTTAKEEEAPAGPPLFQQLTPDCGVNWTYRNGEEAGHLAILESLGGGVALIDYDGDGLLDIFIPGGGYYSKKAEEFTEFDKKGKPVLKDGKKVRKSDPPEILGHPCKLYRNLGNWKFEDVTDMVGLNGKWFYTHGCAIGDYDRDGWPDLLVTGWGRVALFHNEPVDSNDPAKGRKFVDVTEKAGLTGIIWTSSAAWGDLDGDGYPDLYICQYGDWSWDNDPNCQYDGVTDDVCPPKNFSGLRHKMFLNQGNGTFKDVSESVPVLNAKGDGKEGQGLRPGAKDASKGLGVLLVDVNGDRKPDIYVANDTADSFLYVNRCIPGHFRFEERGLVSGTARDGGGSPNGSMGVDAADYDHSGRPSLFVSNYENEYHALYRNDCRGDKVLFQYASRTAGLSALGQSTVGWGGGFLDLDRDGWEDLFLATGHAIRYPTRSGGDSRQRPILLRNQGGVFSDISDQGGPYFRATHLARGVALGDLDNDGRIDLVISHLNEPVVLLHNETPTDNHWLGVELIGREHTDVVGAKLILEYDGQTQTRFAKGGGSYASSSDRRHVFGLGKASKIERLTVTWPNGEREQWKELALDAYHRLVQGKQ